jgi:hypothetical protein
MSVSFIRQTKQKVSYKLLIVSMAIILVSPALFAGSVLGATQTTASANGGIQGTSATDLASSDANSYSSDWLTYHYNNSRDGSFGSLPQVTSPSVSWTGHVDGAVYAEPLYYSGYTYVATENDTVYALNSVSGAIVWSAHLGTPADSVVPPYACDSDTHGPNITPTIGITGTPVIDPTEGVIYVAALINNVGYRLFALNLNTGQQVWNSSITAPGFSYLPQEERGALALANGFVYVPFGGFSWECFTPGSTGWLIAMSATGAGEQHAYNVPSRPEGDIWEPEGVSVDSSGNVYFTTGNSDNPSFDLGTSVVKLTANLVFVNSTANYFSPTNWQYRNLNDLDMSTTGATLLPGNLVFAMGKYNEGYLLNASDLGGIGGQLYNATVCGPVTAPWPYGAWGSTSFANGVIYVPCGVGLDALKLNPGPHPTFTSLWNYTGFFAGPPIIAGGAVWTVTIPGGTLYALNPQTGAVLFSTALGTVDHFATPSAGDGLLFAAANETVYGISPSGGPSTASLSVGSQNTSGQTITGYTIVLYGSSKNELGSGFTPTSFTLNRGQSYSVQADSYGACTFNHWADNGSTSNPRTISIMGNTQLTAVYNCGTTTTSTVTVDSVNQNGVAITGYYTALYNSGGGVVASGFTPKTFSTTAGQAYSVVADGYGSCTFSKWSDGVTSNPRSFTATSSAVTFTADYTCASVASTVTVDSVNQDGAKITGYYTALYSSGGGVVASGFTPKTFSVSSGQAYSVAASGYGSCSFSNWSTTDNDSRLSFVATSVGQTFTAVYDCNNGGKITITVYAHRVPAPYWATCFATVCAAGTGPGATMYYALYNSAGTLVATGFANENGYTFSNLTAGAKYTLRADDCDSCHGSTHNVVFDHWGDGSTTNPIAIVAGSSLDAWYTCTNGCGGGA